MATEKDILEELKAVSGQISNLVRTVGLAIIAFVWLLVIGGQDAPVLPQPLDRNMLIVAGLLALLAMGADYLQYVAGYFSSMRALANKTGDEYSYSKAWPSYRIRTFFFWLKQILLILGFLLLVCAIVRAFV